jgi:hypothetical protein
MLLLLAAACMLLLLAAAHALVALVALVAIARSRAFVSRMPCLSTLCVSASVSVRLCVCIHLSVFV